MPSHRIAMNAISVGWYSAIQFPSAAVWMKVGQISRFSPKDKRHFFYYYQRGE